MNCLDSSFVVDFLDSETDRHDDAVAWMERHGDEPLATPSICAFEVLRGTGRAGDDRFDRARGFLRSLTVLEFDFAEAATAGDLDGQLHADGSPLGARDTIVASAAREHGYALVTRDRDFEAVPGLTVERYVSD